jgi:DNA modification methylase
MTMIYIKIGDCREVLKTMPDKSVHCCVTSPPYYGLRSYLPDCVKLKNNLTQEEISFVINELNKSGVSCI